MITAGFIALAYLLGSVPFAVLASRAFGLPDPRSYGSGNPGATNILRTGRKGAAALTLFGDAAKGWAAVALAQHFAIGEPGIAAAGFAVFLGHLYPLFLGFKGGKGVATALGVLLALSGWLALATALTWVATAALWRYSSLAGVTAAVLAPVYSAWLLGFGWLSAAVLAMAPMLVWRHRSNIRKLLAGTEPKIGAGRIRGASSGG
jgi:glycerol-3-phosphate acyltransferase PlsY